MIKQTENIKVEGHIGTWYVIDTHYTLGERFLLLEHEEYGDEASWLVVRQLDGKVISDECFDFETFVEVLNDYEGGRY